MRTLEAALDPANPGEWRLVDETPSFRRYELDMGDGRVILRTEHLQTDALLAGNAMDRSANAGKRWGGGQVIGRLPLNLYYASGLAEARRQGDEAFIKRFWNDADNARFRTFEGKI